MTIKELCNLDIARLEQMSEGELREWCKPYLVEYVLDPEEVEEEGKTAKKPKKVKKGDVGMMELSAILAANGVKMPEMPNFKKI